MSKSLGIQRKKPPKIIKLPERYPREEKILIFGDMGEIDYVFDLFGRLEENLYSLLPSVTDNAWQDAVNTSCINALIIVLRAACIEFERFWQDDEWKHEDDREFNDWMNEPDELQWLVSYLDSGRVKPVDGKNQRFYEPAYHTAARSLQLAMYFKQMPGDKEWIRYCINELRYNLTRYHAAALEIVMHRENVYLHNKEALLQEIVPYAEIGKESQAKRNERIKNLKKSCIKYSEEDKKKWVEEAERIKQGNPANRAAQSLAKLIINNLSLSERAFESIKGHLLKNGFKAHEKKKSKP